MTVITLKHSLRTIIMYQTALAWTLVGVRCQRENHCEENINETNNQPYQKILHRLVDSDSWKSFCNSNFLSWDII